MSKVHITNTNFKVRFDVSHGIADERARGAPWYPWCTKFSTSYSAVTDLSRVISIGVRCRLCQGQECHQTHLEQLWNMQIGRSPRKRKILLSLL